jgi:hypothetical protein
MTLRATGTPRTLGLLLLAMALSFLAGRATVVPAHAQQLDPRTKAGGPAVEPPPWATHGFRDDESVEDIGMAPGCNG